MSEGTDRGWYVVTVLCCFLAGVAVGSLGLERLELWRVVVLCVVAFALFTIGYRDWARK